MEQFSKTALPLAGEVSADAPGGKRHFGVLRSLPRAKLALPARRSETAGDQYRPKRLQGEVVRPIRELESESQNGNSG